MDRKEGCGVWFKRIEHRHEPTCRDVIGDFPPGLLRDAQSREGPDHRQFRIGCSKRAGHPTISGAIATAETPLGVEMTFGAKDDTGMAGEVVRTSRSPMPRKIIRTGHHDTAGLEQAPANERGIDDGPTSDRDVEHLSDNIGEAILQSEMHAHGRIPPHEITNEWSDPPPPDWRGGGHLQNARRCRALF